MSQKNLTIVAIIAGAFLFIAVRTCNSSANAKRYNWTETFSDNKKHVYGTYIIKRFLDGPLFEGRSDIGKKLSKYFDEDESQSGNYIFVGEAMVLDESDAEALTAFVGQGNQAIISAKIFPHTLSSKIFNPCRENEAVYEPEDEGFDRIFPSEEDEYVGGYSDDYSDEEEEAYDDGDDEQSDLERDSVVELQDRISKIYKSQKAWDNLNFDFLEFSHKYDTSVVMRVEVDSNKSVRTDSIFKTIKNNRPRSRSWYYWHDSLVCVVNNDINILGHVNDTLVNFFEIPYEDGSFFIHTNPLVFANVNLINDQSTAYISNVLNKCPNEKWHWDDYSRTDKNRGMNRNGRSNMIDNKGPLTYILKQAPLAWAWYSTLVMALLFLLFKAKRKQRVIPVLRENENTSLAFINTIGSLYFVKNDHKQLCRDQLQLWLEDIRIQFRVNTSKLDEDFINKLSTKSKVSVEEIQSILNYYKNIENSNFVSENTMIAFYQKINQFDIISKQKI